MLKNGKQSKCFTYTCNRKEQEALACLTYLKSRSFEDLAKEKSLCPSGKRGGNLGWFGRGQMVKQFENAAFSARKGQVIVPVKTKFGYHLVKIVDTE